MDNDVIHVIGEISLTKINPTWLACHHARHTDLEPIAREGKPMFPASGINGGTPDVRNASSDSRERHSTYFRLPSAIQLTRAAEDPAVAPSSFHVFSVTFCVVPASWVIDSQLQVEAVATES
jgi:hypothetical protein